MKIDNGQLAAFAAVLQEGSFEAAARRLHVTPSAISQRMRQLEERLGQVLLQRGSPCQPTAAGRTLARYTEQLALLEAETLAELGDGNGLRGKDGMPLRVPLAVNADSLDSWFPASFDALPAEPAMVFDLRVEDQDHSATLLREGVVMAAVSASAEPVQGCTVEPLGIMRYLGVASPALIAEAFAGGVDAASLARTPMLAFNRKDALQARFIALLIGFDFQQPLPPTHYVPSTAGFVAFAQRGLGWGMMPEPFVREPLAHGTLAEFAPGRHLDVPLYWHRWRLRSPALDAITVAVRQAASKSLLPLGAPGPRRPSRAGKKR
ncbi:LysR family transcriptional regulator ArgP [Cupriavidus gilardii]|nr:LysR family transcriptional regulator ArgP [Cupriavidus gilardii]NSX05125.1 LysR family transcriptional regulator ArgP [Cupriavidus gilardii]